jgi:hypothetical protein
MSDIDKIRNEALTEDFKFETVADFLESIGDMTTLDKVLENGNTATNKTAKFQASGDPQNFVVVNDGNISGQKTTEAGTSTFQITSSGSFTVDFQPADSDSLSIFRVIMGNGTPVVTMSDDVKAAFKAELGIE